jgi:hypothetical protein
MKIPDTAESGMAKAAVETGRRDTGAAGEVEGEKSTAMRGEVIPVVTGATSPEPPLSLEPGGCSTISKALPEDLNTFVISVPAGFSSPDGAKRTIYQTNINAREYQKLTAKPKSG